jgi:alkylated DNA nucleotide flippase Atl1
MRDFESAVVARLRRLRPGEIATYGEIAAEAGFPGAARAVGNVLARTEGLPWWPTGRCSAVTSGSRPGYSAGRVSASPGAASSRSLDRDHP